MLEPDQNEEDNRLCQSECSFNTEDMDLVGNDKESNHSSTNLREDFDGSNESQIEDVEDEIESNYSFI